MSRSFVQSLLARSYSPAIATQILHGFEGVRPSSFRRNTLKISEKDLAVAIALLGFEVTPVLSIVGAYQFAREHEYAFKGSRLFREGLVYLQSLSSMIPAQVLAPSAQARVLDVCAAPGSKTTQMAAMMGNTGEIVALEKSPVRADILRHNIVLQGVTNTVIVRQEGLNYMAGLVPGTFSAILLDAPCSGMGRLSVDRDEPWKYIDPANLLRRSDLQKKLLVRSLELLAPGGVLVYSTCTLGHEENRDVVSAVARTHRGFSVEVPDLTGLGVQCIPDEHGVAILPDANYEGFYISKLIKN